MNATRKRLTFTLSALGLIGAITLLIVGVQSAAWTPTAHAQGTTPTPTATGEITSTAPITEAAILSGTIIANRTEYSVTFFLEGTLYDLRPLRSTGVALKRDASVMTLFNCEAKPEAEQEREDCFWDPYPIRRDGFYEVINGAEAGKPARLLLREAVAPPEGQIWIHNRTSTDERLFYGTEAIDLQPGAIHVLELGDRRAPTLYVRHCAVLGEESVCEWLPQRVRNGVYYALTQEAIRGATRDSRNVYVSLEPILLGGKEATAATSEAPAEPTAEEQVAQPTAVPTPPPAPTRREFACRVLVSALNVRSGPGLQYLVIASLKRTEEGDPLIPIVGRDPEGQWLALDPNIVRGGWISGSPQLVACNGDVATLPIGKVTDGRLAPTPTPTPQPGPQPPAEPQPPQPPAQPAGPVAPAGQALLIVNNAFGEEILFTLSPIVEQLLQPGQSIQVVVNPGRVTFSASSIGRYAGNAELQVGPGEVKTLWLRFEPDPGSERGRLRY
ncbi:MAG: hypothetical protein Kow0047_17150 [Anaerolineae bacterium]